MFKNKIKKIESLNYDVCFNPLGHVNLYVLDKEGNETDQRMGIGFAYNGAYVGGNLTNHLLHLHKAPGYERAGMTKDEDRLPYPAFSFCRNMKNSDLFNYERSHPVVICRNGIASFTGDYFGADVERAFRVPNGSLRYAVFDRGITDLWEAIDAAKRFHPCEYIKYNEGKNSSPALQMNCMRIPRAK